MPSTSNVELCKAVLNVDCPRYAIWNLSESFANLSESFHILLRFKSIDEITRPPIACVSCRNEILVVLHELSIADDNLSIVPNRTDVVANLT